MTDPTRGPTGAPSGDSTGQEIDQAYLDRVRKLLAKAERAGTPDEAETYTAKAVELMTRHGIDDALLQATAGPQARPDPIGATRITITDPYSAAKARLLGWTAAAMRCRWVLHGARRGRVAAVTVFGHASDRARVELLYTSLLLQAARTLAELRPPRPDESVAAYRRSWLYGYATRIRERITQAEQQAVADTERHDDRTAPGAAGAVGVGGAAVVLADRSAAVDRAYGERFGVLRRAPRPTSSGSGYARGVAAADRADLGATRALRQPPRRELR